MKGKTILIGAIGVVLVVLLLVFLGLMGENRDVGKAVIEFFKNVKEQNYPANNILFTKGFVEGKFKNQEEFFQYCFLLESALLEAYDLAEDADYDVELRKSHLWIPFIRKNIVTIDVRLHKPRKTLLRLSSEEEPHAMIRNLFTVEREEGIWRIKDITITDPSFANQFQETRTHINLDGYITMTAQGFSINKIDVDVKNLSPVKKRALSFILKRALRFLGSDDGVDKAKALGVPLVNP